MERAEAGPPDLDRSLILSQDLRGRRPAREREQRALHHLAFDPFESVIAADAERFAQHGTAESTLPP